MSAFAAWIGTAFGLLGWDSIGIDLIGPLILGSIVVVMTWTFLRRVGPNARWGMVVLVVGSVFAARAGVFRMTSDSRDIRCGPASKIVDLSVTFVDVPVLRVDGNGRSSWWISVLVDRSDLDSILGTVVSARLDRPGGFESPGVSCRLRARLETPDTDPDLLRFPIRRPKPFLSVPHPGSITLREDVDQHRSILGSLPAYVDWVWAERVTSISESVGIDGSLISMLLRGIRPFPSPTWIDDARRSGLGHLFAVSGLHLGLVGGTVLLFLGRNRRWVRGLAWCAIALFASGVVPGPSISRAMATATIGTVCLILGRRPRGDAVVAVGSAMLLWIDPGLLGRVGFQLSVVATLGLIVVGPWIRHHWFGPRRIRGDRIVDVVVEPIRGLAAASLAAWLVTIPISASHFGFIALASVPATILIAPIFVPVMAMTLGFACITVVVPSLHSSLGSMLQPAVGLLVHSIESIGSVSPTVATNTPSTAAWIGTATALAVVFGWRRLADRRFGMGVLIVMIVSVPISSRIGVKSIDRSMTMIDVGDGTSIVLQSGDRATLYDVGSLHRDSIGRRVVVPTLRDMGVQSIDSIVLSHPNRDHFSGVMDVISAMPVGEVVLTSQFLDIARGPLAGAAGDLLSALSRSNVAVREVHRGDRWCSGSWSFRVVHPSAEDRPKLVNDSSLVIDVEGVDRWKGRRILLCGDLQRWGMATVMSREPRGEREVMEVPHHGSRDPLLHSFIDHFDPKIVVQSTGERRYRRGRGSTWWRGRVRFVTCRDGSIRIDGSGGSEEPETSFVSGDSGDLGGAGPHDHDRAID